MMLTEQDIQEIVDRVVEVAAPEKIILFGSYATGTATEDSDVDLLVIKESGLPRHKRAVPINKALYGKRKPVDVAVYTSAEISEWQAVPQAFVSTALKQGRVMYENPA